MKTYLIQLQKFDTLSATIEKMSWAKEKRVLLIWPKRGKPLLSIPDVELIKREALAMGVELAFVCTDSEVIEFADAKEISVFQSVTQAERESWKKPGGEFSPKIRISVPPKVRHRESSNGAVSVIVRGFSLLLAGLAVIALVLFFIPSATITVHPLLTTREIVIDVWASPEVASLNINGSLPAQVQVINLTKTATGQSSGSAGLPSSFAEGQVVITNISTQAVTVPIGTVLMTNDENQTKFATQEETVLDPGAMSAPIDIRAVDPGTTGNVVAGAITTIEGQLAGLLDVNNDAPTSGGEDVEAPSPTEEDYDALREQMLNSLRQEALSLYPQGDIQLIAATLDDGTITSELRSVDPGTAADTFSLMINVEFKGLTYSSSDLDKIIDGAMEASLDKGTMIYSQGVQFEQVGQPTGNISDGATWSIKARAETGTVVDKNTVITALAGKDTGEALILIDSLVPSREAAEIQTFPGFWSWMPWFSLNTRIVAE
jgi:hypothetical protein